MKKSLIILSLSILIINQANSQIFINTTATTNDTDPTYRMGSTTIGRNTVGIEKLDVEGNIAIPFGSYLGVNNSNITNRKFLQTNWNTSVGDFLSFYTAGVDAQNQYEKMRITMNGNVGIGATNPLLKLDIETNSTNDGIRVKQTGNTIASLNLEASTGRRWALFSTGSGNGEGAGNFGLYDYSGGGYRMFVNGSTGNTGFGTITPKQMLNVNNGALLLSGAVPDFGGPQLLFSDNASVTPNGRWAIEYSSIGGLNFWTPWNPSGPVGTAGNYSLFLKNDGKIGMGVTDDPGDGNFCATSWNGNYRLYVNGGILTTKVKVANYCSASWADYVFAPDYALTPLADVETYIKEHKHLPNIPSAMEIEKEGLDLADIQSKQMAKIEELTLYMIDMKKEIDELKKQNAALQAISSSSKN